MRSIKVVVVVVVVVVVALIFNLPKSFLDADINQIFDRVRVSGDTVQKAQRSLGIEPICAKQTICKYTLLFTSTSNLGDEAGRS